MSAKRISALAKTTDQEIKKNSTRFSFDTVQRIESKLFSFFDQGMAKNALNKLC